MTEKTNQLIKVRVRKSWRTNKIGKSKQTNVTP